MHLPSFPVFKGTWRGQDVAIKYLLPKEEEPVVLAKKLRKELCLTAPMPSEYLVCTDSVAFYGAH